MLAKNGAAPIGDLRYLADTKLNNIATPPSQLAAALALVGDRARAERVYAALQDLEPKPVDYGLSAMRRRWSRSPAKATRRAQRWSRRVQRVEAARADALYLHAGECVAGAGRTCDREGGQHDLLDVDGSAVKSAVFNSYKQGDVAAKPIRITNTGDAPVQAVVSVSGAPLTPEPAAENGFKIERTYHTLDGKPADIAKAKQNDRLPWC